MGLHIRGVVCFKDGQSTHMTLSIRQYSEQREERQEKQMII